MIDLEKIRREGILLLTISVLLLTFALGFFQMFFGFILLFFLPGYALTLTLFPGKEIDILERISLAIALSISVSVVSVFAANYFFGIPITSETIMAEILSLSGIFILIYFFRRPGSVAGKGISLSDIKSVSEPRKRILSVFIILLILILTFNLIYRTHWNYPYPFHTDEWQHIAIGVQIVEDKSIRLTIPYYQDKPPYRNLEIGFHVFLAEFFLLTNKDLVLFYKFLPAIFACISAFILFVFIYKITGKFLAAIFSMLFFAGLKSNIFVLGSWFFVPLTMSFPLLYLVFYSLSEGLKEGSFPLLLSATIALLALALIHPSIASFAYMSITLYLILAVLYSLTVIILYLVSKRESFKKELGMLLKFPIQRAAGILILFLVPFLSFLYFLKFLWKGSLVETLRYFVTDFMIFDGSLPVKELYKPLFLCDIYGLVGISLAIIGIIYVLIKKKGAILVSGISIALAIMALYQFHGFSILLLYERTTYCALLCLAPLSGIGLYVLTYFIKNILKNSKVVSTVIALSLLFFVFLNTFSNYYFYEDKIYRMIDDDDYKAIKWLGENKGSYNIVLARPRISDAIYPISRNYVVAITPHGGTAQNLLDTRKFLMSGCEGRKNVLEKYQVDYVLVKFKIKCGFLEEIYHQGKDYIYEVQIS